MEILRSRFWKECGQVALIAGLLLGACKKDKKSGSPAEQPSTETDTESYSASGGSGGGSFSSGDIPATPALVITSPSGLSVTTALEPVRFEGSCLSGLDVVVTGDVVSGEILTPASGALYQPCIADRFQFEINKSSAGTFKLQFAQGLLGVVPFSLPVEISWTVATTSGPSVPSSQVLPSPPVITQPTGNTSTSNSSTFTVAGTCDNGMQVVIGGSIGAQDVLAPTAGSNSVNCVAGAFSFTIGKTSDNSYTVSLLQRDSQTQLDSSAVQITWVRDTLAPTAPLVTQPSQSPFYDSSSGVTLSGTCESGAQVFLSGGETMSVACAAGQFSFNSNKSADGTYNYTLRQTDPAGNQSATTTLQWVRSASVMPPPTVQSPAANPIYSKNRSLTISGGCTTNATVTLSGAVTASEVSNPSQSLSRTCTASSYSFTLTKSLDGVYDLQVSQSDPATLAISQPASLTWNVDNMPPVAPLVITPAGGSVTSGDTALAVLVQCERWSTVNWSGTSSGTWSGANTGSGLCSDAGDFATSIAQTGDATYAISFTQTDRAGNQSAATIVNWTRDTTLLPTPVFSSPSVSPIWTTTPTMVISGSCTTGFNVDLSGDVTPSEVTLLVVC